MKSFFTLIFVFLLCSARATNYYFSAVSGDDSRSSAQARNASTPWKTLAKLNSFFINLRPGDAVLLKRGETFHGSIKIKKSGEPGRPIVIGAYGTGSKPVITSLITLSGWVSKGNGIWESQNSSLGKSLNTVLINNVWQEMGRYPNSDGANKGYLTLESHTGNSITDNELNSYPDWTGAEVVIRMNRWITDRCLITKHRDGQISYNPGSGYSASDNFGYFIQNDIKTLDKFGEWYYNPSAKKISIYFGAKAPSSYVIQAATIDDLISATAYSNIVLDNLNVTGSNSDNINIRGGLNTSIMNCDISFSGESGVCVKYSNKSKIENCTVSNSNVNGIDLGYGGDYMTVRNNKITNTSVFAGMGRNGDGKGFGIHSYGNSAVIEYNEIINTSYCAINFNGNSTIVKNNFINNFCITKDDGGGIYTYLGKSAPHKGSKVIGNIILNGAGAGEGAGYPFLPSANGIYMDNNTANVEIRDNTVANCSDMGIYLHNANNITIKNNTVYNNSKQFLANQDNNRNLIRNCILTGNNFFSKSTGQPVLTLRSSGDDISHFGRFDSNYYNRPLAQWSIITASYLSSDGRVKQNLDLEDWKAEYGKDKASKKSAKQVSAYKLNSLKSSNKYPNGTFSSGKRAVYPSYCQASVSNAGQLDGKYLEVSPSARYSSVFADIGSLKANKKYIVRYSVRGSVSKGVYIGVSLRKKVSPYTVLTPIQNSKVNLSRSNIEMAFSPSSDQSDAQIVFYGNSKNKYYLDNIELYEADAKITNINDSIRFEYNSSGVSKTVRLAGNYVDAKNNKYSNSILLPPYTSAVLIKNEGAANTVGTPPVVSITSPSANAGFKAPATIEITADASAADGTISKVEFYNGNTLLQTEINKPYTCTWKNVPAGKYTLTAKATDSKGNETTSASVSISVAAPSSDPGNAAPKVSITSPSVNASYTAPATIRMIADASDADGTIRKVEFYNGNTLLRIERYEPYTYTWNNVPAGKYTLTAKATDDKGGVTTSASVSISVAASSSGPSGSNKAPEVYITSPVANQSYKAAATVNISVNASDADGKVKKIEFYNGSVLIHTELGKPYSWNWKHVKEGNYTITAIATDDKGAETRSKSVTISVTAKKTSHRAAGNTDTSALNVIKIDTLPVEKNKYVLNLKPELIPSKPAAEIYTLKVFPNPAVNKIQISVEGLQIKNQKAKLSITNLSGIIVRCIPVVLSGKTLQANVSSFTPGMYIISIISDDIIISTKFIKN